MRAIVEFRTPTLPKQVKQYLGMVGYYRQSIDKFSQRSEPLLRLLRNGALFDLKADCQQAFEDLKTALTTAPVLTHYYSSLPIRLHSDAIYEGLGFILCHVSDGVEHPFIYGSRTLSNCELNYGVTELECLAVVWAITKNRHLLGLKFEVIVDHHSLCWLLRAKCPSGRISRWCLLLAEYDFTICYKT